MLGSIKQKISRVSFFLLLGIFLFRNTYAQAPGDLALISAVGGAGTTPDRFRVIALAAIPPNTAFTFTDNVWDGNALATNEGNLVWTSPSSGLPAGTVIAFDATSNTFSNGGTVSHGTITSVSNAGFSFTSLDDNIFIYKGTTPPASGSSSLWIWGINGRAWGTTGIGGASGLNYQPSALVGYSVAMINPSNGRNAEYYYANGTSATSGNIALSGTKAAILANITNNTKYYRNDVSAQPTGQPPYPTYTATVTTPLPLTLLALSVSREGGLVRAAWETADEQQVDYMELQRSGDAQGFEPAGRINAGNTPGRHTYSLTDAAPQPGACYYRLAIKNRNGSVEYSKTVSLPASDTYTAPHLVVVPNPVQGRFSIRHPQATAGARITILSLNGRPVASRLPGEGSVVTDFPEMDLPASTYMAVFENKGQRVTCLFRK